MDQASRGPVERMRQIRRRAALMALCGVAVSAAVYLAEPPDRANPLGYDPMDSKAYLRQLELYGGTANVLSVELQQWFLGLWHGRSLAYTLLFIFLAASALYWLLAGRMELLRRAEESGAPRSERG